MAGQGDKSAGGASAGGTFVERDDRTGQTYLKMPVPSGEMLGRAVLWLQTLTGVLQPPRGDQ